MIKLVRRGVNMEILNNTKLTFDELIDLLAKSVSNKKKMIVSAI